MVDKFENFEKKKQKKEAGTNEKSLVALSNFALHVFKETRTIFVLVIALSQNNFQQWCLLSMLHRHGYRHRCGYDTGTGGMTFFEKLEYDQFGVRLLIN